MQKKYKKGDHDPLSESAIRDILKRTSVRSLKKLPVPKINAKYKDLPVVPTNYTALPKQAPDKEALQAYVRLEEISADL